jgi:ATP-dependent helicase Lhr and Lhr-like helicase
VLRPVTALPLALALARYPMPLQLTPAATDALAGFHPAVRAWFAGAFSAPTSAQAAAWPAIQAGRHVLVAAPTGSGKTLAAFLAAIDALVREGVRHGLPDETRIVYVSPLKALSNDIQRNLEAPLAGIREALANSGYPDVNIRTLVRTGDTSQRDRVAMRKVAPHIVVTTPESLYILLTSKSGRAALATTRMVIVDEVHALAPNKRGMHLALSLERLAALTGRRLTRVGLSATQNPVIAVAHYLVGADLNVDGTPACTIIDSGHVRARDIAIELPPAPLEAVMSHETWSHVYDRLAALALAHRTTLIFVNTRRLAERAARFLSERIGAEHVTAHHGSLAREQRFQAEQRLKRGELRALVATASLELGIDIGDVDLVCQIGSPHSISAFLQRIGRSGHAVDGMPKGRLFPLSRDDLVECAALVDSVRRGELDRLKVPELATDVLAQQLVAEVSQQDWSEEALFDLVRRAFPYRLLDRAAFTEIARMVSEGFHTRFGRRSAHLHRDVVGGMLRARRGSALTAVTSGGTIPDMADYTVLLEPQAQVIGTVNEDFAIESLAGDVFQLGNTSYRILRVERGTVRVEDAKGAPPGIPFWLGEAPGRTDVLSEAVSRLNNQVATALGDGDIANVSGQLVATGLDEPAAVQIAEYLGAAFHALGALPTKRTVIFERFFDESGGMQLVIHSPFGSRVNRAWGLALRKRFCRTFNFELQAAAIEDAIVLSLATSHSFELHEVTRYLSSKSVRPLLVQALLDAPMFVTRWRWNASIALALPRFRGGKKVAPQLQRMQAEDLLATVFPDQVACGENIVGDREIPDHPLVAQTIHDCLYDAMDVDGLEQVLRQIESGAIEVIVRDLTEPSPLALEILSARPYAFLDDAPLEERRTQAVMARRWLDPQVAGDLGKLDAAAISRVREEAFPEARNSDELHDALLALSCLTAPELGRQPEWSVFFETLCRAGRATKLCVAADVTLAVAAERLPEWRAIFPGATMDPVIAVPLEYSERAWTHDDALIEVLRDRLGSIGPTTESTIATALGLDLPAVEQSCVRLETEGTLMRGQFTGTSAEWCDRRLLARIHRYTVNRLRQEIEPVEPRDFMRFLFRWQRVEKSSRGEGPDAVAAVISQLEGFEVPAAAWETEILPARIAGYDPAWLDELSFAGRVVWLRLSAPGAGVERVSGPVRTTPIALVTRRNLARWTGLSPARDACPLGARAAEVAQFLEQRGASFFGEIVAATRLLPTQIEEALAELTAYGLINADGFVGLRALLVPSDRRRAATSSSGQRRRRRTALFGIEDAGRWALVRRHAEPVDGESEDSIEQVARTLLKRYGVVFWRLIEREASWLPPWRLLLRELRRLEARGEIRGGRFVAGIAGEQFALPDAIGAMREVRRSERSGELVCVSGADPLNLIGIVLPGPKLAALAGNRVAYRDGVPLATLAGGNVRVIEPLEPRLDWEIRNLLIRRNVPPVLAALDQ